MNNNFIENANLATNFKAVLYADISSRKFLPRLTKDIFEGLTGENKEEFLESLKLCQKTFSKLFRENKEKYGIDKTKFLKDFANGKLLMTIKAYIDCQSFEKISYNDFNFLIESGAFNYTSTKKPVFDFFKKDENNTDSEPKTETDETENEIIGTDENLETEAKETEVKEVKEKTPFEKASKMINTIKQMDLSIEEISKLAEMLKQC